MNHTATYSPEDNKLRLYPAARLDAETYARVKAAGFTWAPKQELFVAPAWTPAREDLLRELAGEIGDEDTTLADRAEARAERFEDYAERRQADASAAHAAVRELADGIPLGQPILVGHHSEKRARKDAERIQSGMRKAVRAWETSQYWEQRAAGAIRAAKHKERPDVRARRIRTIEAEARKHQRERDQLAAQLKTWQRLHEPDSVKRKDGQPTTFLERALYVANHDHGGVTLPDGSRHWSAWSALNDGTVTPEEVQRQRLEGLPRLIAHADRWLAHLANRLTYERAMLAADGGTVADRTGPEKGGAVRCWASPRGGWSYIQKVNRVSVTVLDNWGNGGRNFTRTIPLDKLSAVMTAAQVAEARTAGRLHETDDKTGFFLTDAPPASTTAEAAAKETRAERNARTHREHVAEHGAPAPAADFAAMRETLRAGVQVAAVPQLFPTPPELAERMVRLAALPERGRVLEPSAGTGQLLGLILHPDRNHGHGLEAVAVEIDARMVDMLRAQQRAGAYPLASIRQADFLQCNGDLGTFDRILMNPPFERAADVEHITHALKFLRPGGRLVAICANGPRQAEQLRPMVERAGGTWEPLPAGTFKESGTSVNAALLVIDAPPAARAVSDEPQQPLLL